MPENYKKLLKVPIGQWFSVINKSNEDMTGEIKQLIDGNEPFVFTDYMKRFKRQDDPFLK